MGGSKGSGGTNTVTSSSAPPPQVMANYQAVTQQAQGVAATPYQAYTGQEVAPLNAQQTAAGTEAANAVGSYQPYFNTAQGMISQGTQPITPTTVNAADINQYMSPYNTSVINATEAQMNQNDQTQQQQLTGNAIAAGAFGGDRAAVAASTLAGQQDLANNQTIAGLENQNYTQALGEANTQQQTGMTAQQANAANLLQGSGLTGALGNYATTNQLNTASANEAAGQVAQGTQQAQDTAAYQQFEQELQYPFQTTGWLAGIDTGTGGASGGTSSTTSPGPSLASQVTGLGEFGLGAYGAATSGQKRGGPIRGYASGGSPSSDMPDFSVSYVPNVPNVPSFGGGSSMLKPSGTQSTTTGQPQQSPMALQLAGKGLGHLLGPSGGSGASGPSAGIAQTSLGPEQVGVEYPVGESAIPSSSLAGDILWDNPAAGATSGIAGSLGMGDIASDSTMAALTGGADAADAAIADAGVEAGAADLGESALAADAGDTIDFAKRGGPIRKYASGGNASTPNYPLTYILQNPTLGSNMNSIMGGGYGGALSGLGPTSPGYASGGGIMPKKYASAGFVSPPPMTSGGIGTGKVGDSIPYMAINNVSGMGYNDPTAPFNWGSSPSNYTPMPTQSMASAPTSQGIPSAPSVNGQSAMGANGPMSTAGSSGISGTPSMDSSGTTTIAGVPALGSSTSGQPQDLTDLEAKLQANAPVLDKNEALMRAGLATMAGTNPHALTNIGAGGLQGVEDYSQQKAAVRDYGLKEAEVEDRAKQMQNEADRFKQQMQIEQENADTNKGYKDAIANARQTGTVENQQWEAYQAAHKGEPIDQQISGFTQATKPAAVTSPAPTARSTELMNLSGDDYIAQLAKETNPNYANMVKSLADTGNVPSPKTGKYDNSQELEDIYRYQGDASTATKTAINRFNSGVNGNQIKFASTAMTHLDTVSQAADALANNDTQALNKMQNSFKSQFGSPAPTNFNAARDLATGEIVKAITMTGGSTEDRDRAISNLQNAESPAQLKGVISTYQQMLGGQLYGNYNEFKSATGQSDQKFLDKLDTTAKSYMQNMMKAHGVNAPSSTSAAAPMALSPQQFGLSPNDLAGKEGKFFTSGGNRYQVVNGNIVKASQ